MSRSRGKKVPKPARSAWFPSKELRKRLKARRLELIEQEPDEEDIGCSEIDKRVAAS